MVALLVVKKKRTLVVGWTTIDMSVVRKFPSLLDGGSVMFELEGQTMDDVCRVVVSDILGCLALVGFVVRCRCP